MCESLPEVLWIDEDQGELSAVAWVIANCGARVKRALTVRDGLTMLSTMRPAAIVLDIIVRVGETQEARQPYSGLAVWCKLDPELRARTLVLSMVPFDQLSDFADLTKDRFFWKIDLVNHLQEFEQALRDILRDQEPLS